MMVSHGKKDVVEWFHDQELDMREMQATYHPSEESSNIQVLRGIGYLLNKNH